MAITTTTSIMSSRRSFLSAAVLLGAGAALSACATGGRPPGTAVASAAAINAANPFGASDSGLEVFIFDGGYGSQYPKKYVELYNQAFPQSKVSLSAVQEVSTQLQPRFVKGSPPDVVNNAGGKALDLRSLVAGNQLADLQQLLDAPSIDDPSRTVEDTLLPGVVEYGSYDGKFMVLNYVSTVYGLWYDKALFAKHGWEMPETWDELLDLGEAARGKGIALFTYGGTNAASYLRNVVTALAVKDAGLDVIKRIDNLEPDAWRQDSVRKALEAVSQLHSRDLILKGSEGLKHTEAQTAFVRGEAALYACGSWLENEMAKITPAGFQMTVAPVPNLNEKSALDYSAIEVSPGEPYVIPSQASNAAGALSYLRFMLSKEGARNFSTITKAPTVVAGALEGLDLSPALKSVQTVTKDAAETNLYTFFNTWYPTLGKLYVQKLGELLAGRADAAAFIDALQQEADRVKSDATITKRTRA